MGVQKKGQKDVCKRIKSPRVRKNEDNFSLSTLSQYFVTAFPGGIFGSLLLVKDVLQDLSQWHHPRGSSILTSLMSMVKTVTIKRKGFLALASVLSG